MLDAATEVDLVGHVCYAPGEFPARWHGAAYELHCHAWPTPWQGQLSRDRFIAELNSDYVDALCERHGNGQDGALLLRRPVHGVRRVDAPPLRKRRDGAPVLALDYLQDLALNSDGFVLDLRGRYFFRV